MDSTFVSMLQNEQLQDQTFEQVQFDHTLDNMSMLDGGEGTLSELLRDKSPRSRFISDESIFAGHDDILDKQFEVEEETKGHSFSLFRQRRPRAVCSDLLAPLADDDEDMIFAGV